MGALMRCRDTRPVRAANGETADPILTAAWAPALAATGAFTLAAVAPAGHVSFGLGIAVGAFCAFDAVLAVLGVRRG